MRAEATHAAELETLGPSVFYTPLGLGYAGNFRWPAHQMTLSHAWVGSCAFMIGFDRKAEI